MTWSQFWQGYPESYYNSLTFWTAGLSFHSIISLSIAPLSPVLHHHQAFTTFFLFFLSPVPHSSVRLSTTQAPLYAVCLFLQGKTCSAVTAALTGEQTLILIRTLLAADRDAMSDLDVPWSIVCLFSTHTRMTRTRTDAHLVRIRVITCNNVQRNARIYCRDPVRHKSFSHSWVSPWANASCQEAIKPHHTPKEIYCFIIRAFNHHFAFCVSSQFSLQLTNNHIRWRNP